MNLDSHWINLVILFGAVHGLVFGLILLFNRKHPGAPFLGLFIFVLAYNGFETLNWSAGLDHSTENLKIDTSRFYIGVRNAGN